MSYETFRCKVNALIERAGGDIRVRFSKDDDTGKFFANCSDGTTIIGNRQALRVAVQWNGRVHQGIATI